MTNLDIHGPQNMNSNVSDVLLYLPQEKKSKFFSSTADKAFFFFASMWK